MFNKKYILAFFSIFFLLFSVSAFSHDVIPTPLGSTVVDQALKTDLNDEGKWNQITFADDTTQTTAAASLAPLSSDGTDLTLASGHLNLPQENDAVTPTLQFTPGYGFFMASSTLLNIAIAGSDAWRFTSTALESLSASGPRIRQTGSSATQPTLIPDRTDADSGIGQGSVDELSIIVGAIEAIHVTEASTEALTDVQSNGVDTSPILELSNTARDIQYFLGSGSPEGVQTGSIGDKYTDTVGGDLYIKNTGTASNTGWVAIGGAVPVYKSYSLANPGTADTFYIGGHYSAPAAHVVLTIGGSVTQVHGTANEANGTHSFCVASGAGGTDLVLTVTGISITDAGVRNGSDSEIIVADADQAITDQYFETTKKWLGQVTYTLTGAAGAFTFNYGHVKYDDFGNKNFTITDFEATGLARANETGLNIELLHHEATAFVYSAGAFTPNATPLISLATDYTSDNDVGTGEGFSYKRSGLSTAVAGGDGEGLIIRVTTAVNNSINHANFHVGVHIN